MATAAVRKRAGVTDRAFAVAVFHALSDETRLAALEMLRGGERCVCELQDALGAAQSRLSFHLKVLKDAGLVTDRKEGRWSYYAISAERVAEAMAALGALATPGSRDAAVVKLHTLERAAGNDGRSVATRVSPARRGARGDGCC